jgi:peptidoglycan/xylan/chitin deacetylase (PgdA/CDA1 family)
MTSPTRSNPFQNTLTVFTFHRLVNEVDPLFPEYHTTTQFDAIVRVLKRYFSLHTLSSALEIFHGRHSERPLACITFDDGYVDNYELAMPLLVKHNAVASFFVSTKHLESESMFSDLIAEGVRRASGKVNLEKWNLGTYDLVSNKSKLLTHRALSEKIKYIPKSQRDKIAIEVFEYLSNKKSLLSQMMSEDQVRALSSAGMEIGSHTHSHIILTQETSSDASADILHSKRILEALLQKPILGFAYPNGKSGLDFNQSSIELIKAMGFAYAATTNPNLYAAGFDDFQIPRTSIWHKSAITFEFMLARYLVSHLVKKTKSKN